MAGHNNNTSISDERLFLKCVDYKKALMKQHGQFCPNHLSRNANTKQFLNFEPITISTGKQIQDLFMAVKIKK